ncbi:leghemoglobin reductase [Chaetomidium leptoderma]|uniref:Leghemoglobin reductase n=1 Tax=Chaetomidium leptoderma TaxID=669021 RepID=A0AAN6VML4_9PEZI|nr:leghemoglobin reductase [Chaetomidium leptoderma]
MSNPEQYDFVALGGGEAAKLLAWDLASNHGKKCAVIEHGPIAGACPTVACMPTKTLIHSAQLAHLARQVPASAPGTARADIKTDMAKVFTRKQDVVDGMADLFLGIFAETKAELIRGHGELVGPKTISCNGRLLTGETVLINTGSKALVDTSIPGLANAKPLTHVELLNIKTLPTHLIILGGGYVGIEFAQAYVRFGARVTVIERNAQVLKKEDSDVISALTKILAREGVEFLTSTSVTKVSGTSGDEVVLTLSGPGGPSEIIRGSHLLVSAGRTPNTSGIGLAEAGIQLSPAGHVAVDEQLRTSVPGVFAAGDCAGSPYFTHIGWDDHRVILASLTGSPREGGTANRQVPSTLFTSPELAHVGLREEEAKARGIPYRLTKAPMAAFLRSRALGETEGFAKALVEADGDKVLGFTALGPGAGELLPAVQLVMKLGLSYKELVDLIIVHPTMCEGLVDLFRSVPPRTG